MFRRTHVIIRELFFSLLSYTKKFMQFVWWYVLKSVKVHAAFLVVYAKKAYTTKKTA
jgi:hypothetical protein